MSKIWKTLYNLPAIGIIFNVGIYSWTLLFSLVLIRIRKMNTDNIIILLPIVLSLLVCFASPVNGYIRYGLPIIISMPLLFGLFVKGDKVELEKGN